jgi:hypothetical protein
VFRLRFGLRDRGHFRLRFRFGDAKVELVSFSGF